MNTQKRIIDASKILPATNGNRVVQQVQRPVQQVRVAPQTVQQQTRQIPQTQTVQSSVRAGTPYVPKQIIRQPVSIGVHPNANLIYQSNQPVQQPQPAQQVQVQQPQPVQQVQQPQPAQQVQVQQANTKGSTQKSNRSSILLQDPEMKGFDLSGNDINEVYNNNAHRIKIVPE